MQTVSKFTRKLTLRGRFVIASAFCVMTSGIAGAALNADAGSPQYVSTSAINGVNGKQGTGPEAAAARLVYDNVTAPAAAQAGYSEAVTSAPTFGDSLNMTGSGTLDEQKYVVYNSSSGGNTGSITGGTTTISYYRQSDSSYIGGFSGTFTTTLTPGQYTIIDFTSLSGLTTPIVFDTPNIIVTQSTVITGTSTRQGDVLFNPNTVGSSADGAYISSTATAAGYYTFTGIVPANWGYAVGLTPEPSSLALGGLALIGLARRNRKA